MQETMTNAGVAAKHFAALSTNAKGVSAFGIDKENHDWILGFGKFWRIACALLCTMPSSPFVLFVFNVCHWNSIALLLDFQNWMEMHAGAHTMDQHFLTPKELQTFC
jgi:glucose-6-phosphate isomerase